MSADYRFSLQRPTQRFRGLSTTISRDAARLFVGRPTPGLLTPFEEPRYTEQTREYTERRIPIFERNLAAIVAETERLVALYQSRMSVGTVQGSGEQAMMVMPVTGACPMNGPLAYVYDDICAAAQRNLASLGAEKPPRWSTADVVARWADLINWNISLFRRASNVDGRFMFPETYGRAAEAYRPSSWGSRRGGTTRTLETQQGGFGPGETPVYRSGLPYPHNGEEGAVPQAILDLSESLDRNLRSVLRMATTCVRMGPAGVCLETRPAPIVSEACLYNPTDSCPPQHTLDYPRSGWSRNLTDLGITRSRLEPIRETTSPFGLKNLEFSLFTTPEQISSNWIRIGDKGDTTPGGAWDKLSTVFQKTPRPGETNPWTGSTYSANAQGVPMTGWGYWNPINELMKYQNAAREWSRVSLPKVISDAIAWYVFNHNVWYAEKLGLTAEQLRAQQRAVASAGLDRTSGPILGVTGAVGSAVNPAIGIIIGILNAIGKELLLEFVRITPDMPKPLFLRVPDPAVCEGRPEEQAGRSLCPEGTTGAFPNCVPIPPTDEGDERGGFPIVPVAAAAGAALLLFLAAKKRKERSQL